MKLKYCMILAVVTFLLTQVGMLILWLPLVGLIQGLAGGENGKAAQVPVPRIWHVPAHPAFALSVVALALVSVAFIIRGLTREPGSKAGWIVLLVFSVIVLLMAGGFAFFAPKFAMLYYDLGIK